MIKNVKEWQAAWHLVWSNHLQRNANQLADHYVEIQSLKTQQATGLAKRKIDLEIGRLQRVCEHFDAKR